MIVLKKKLELFISGEENKVGEDKGIITKILAYDDAAGGGGGGGGGGGRRRLRAPLLPPTPRGRGAAYRSV